MNGKLRVRSKGKPRVGAKIDRLSFHEMRDYAIAVNLLVLELQDAVDGKQINPNQLRAIYQAIKIGTKQHKKKDLLGCYNADCHDEKSLCYFEQKGLELYFVNSKLTGNATKLLSGKQVFIQLPSERQRDEMSFAWAKVISSEGNQPKEWLVKISTQKKYAEEHLGETTWIEVRNILRISSSTAPLILEKGSWSYKLNV